MAKTRLLSLCRSRAQHRQQTMIARGICQARLHMVACSLTPRPPEERSPRVQSSLLLITIATEKLG